MKLMGQQTGHILFGSRFLIQCLPRSSSIAEHLTSLNIPSYYEYVCLAENGFWQQLMHSCLFVSSPADYVFKPFETVIPTMVTTAALMGTCLRG